MKLDKVKKLWYILSHTLWLLLPKLNFWKRDWALYYSSTQVWDFCYISSFPKIVSLQSVKQLVYQVCYIRNQVLFYLRGIRTVLRHFKDPQYYMIKIIGFSFLKYTQRERNVLRKHKLSYTQKYPFSGILENTCSGVYSFFQRHSPWRFCVE